MANLKQLSTTQTKEESTPGSQEELSSSFAESTTELSSDSEDETDTYATAPKPPIGQNPEDKTSVLTLIRTAERVDRIFPTWIEDNFSNGHYIIKDLNLPLRLPQRKENIRGFATDTPITEFGRMTSQLTGRGLLFIQHPPEKILSSPALRCIQTAAYILRPLNDMSLKICIEPGLFEWTKWESDFMTTKELINAGYPIDETYKPFMTTRKIQSLDHESLRQAYGRIKSTLWKILDDFPGQSVLVVGHGVTLDACARGLLGKTVMKIKEADMAKIGLHYPYNSSLVLKEDRTNNEWHLDDEELPPISFMDFTNAADYTFLNR